MSVGVVTPEPSIAGRYEPDDGITALLVRVHGEYTEMPGLRLNVRQAARLFDLPADLAHVVLTELEQAAVLSRSDDGTYLLRR